MPARADLVAELDTNRRVIAINRRTH
jgi:hypothetical protein